MVRLVMILLGAAYFQARWRSLVAAGCFSVVMGVFTVIDALDGALDFPVAPFAVMLLIEGLATIVVAFTGVGGQRSLRLVKGVAVVAASLLILGGQHHGNFVLSMIFGTLLCADGLLQVTSAWLVRFRTWRLAVAGGVAEIALGIFFYQPYPDHYAGTLPYFLGLGLLFAGWNLMLLGFRVRQSQFKSVQSISIDTPFNDAPAPAAGSQATRQLVWEGPPADHEPALTVHVWTPLGSAKGEVQRQPLIDRYIAAVDKNGVISTGHAAMESPEGIYISLYPGVEIDRSPDEFTRVLRATRENDVPGLFQPDYPTESKAWCPSTTRVRIRNYDARRLHHFWEAYRSDNTYNLTHRNCSSSVSRALDAALEGVVGRLATHDKSWWPLVRLILTPELWVAAQIRKRAATMAWTPGLTLDYARALSMLADPRPSAWSKIARFTAQTVRRPRP